MVNRGDVGELALTGWLGLMGNVEKIGGVKGKLLAIKNRGCSTVIFPEANKEEVKAAVDGLWQDSSSPATITTIKKDMDTSIITITTVKATTTTSGHADGGSSSSSPSATHSKTKTLNIHFVRHVLDVLAITIDGK